MNQYKFKLGTINGVHYKSFNMDTKEVVSISLYDNDNGYVFSIDKRIYNYSPFGPLGDGSDWEDCTRVEFEEALNKALENFKI